MPLISSSTLLVHTELQYIKTTETGKIVSMFSYFAVNTLRALLITMNLRSKICILKKTCENYFDREHMQLPCKTAGVINFLLI